MMLKEIVQRIRALIGVFVIRAACSDPVADAFDQIAVWHLHRLPYAVDRVIPVFPVVRVSAFMVQPSHRVSFFFLLDRIRASPPLVIVHGRNELRRAVFREIMGESLPVQAARKAVLPHQGTMVMHSFQMACESLPERHVLLRFVHTTDILILSLNHLQLISRKWFRTSQKKRSL